MKFRVLDELDGVQVVKKIVYKNKASGVSVGVPFFGPMIC